MSDKKMTTDDVWATEREFGGNKVRQLLVPAGELSLTGSGNRKTVASNLGVWPLATGAQTSRNIAAKIVSDNKRSRAMKFS